MAFFTVLLTLFLVCVLLEKSYGFPCSLTPGSPQVYEYAPEGTSLDYGSFNGTLGEDIANLTLRGDLATYCELQNETLVVKSNITRQPSGFLDGVIDCIQADTAPVSNNITVQVQRIQLTPPKFNEPSYSANISESYPNNDTVLSVRANDEDGFPVQYIIYSQDPPDFFKISANGDIFLDEDHKLNYSAYFTHYLTVSANSIGPNNVAEQVKMSSCTSVIISIEDSDNNPPQFQPCTFFGASCLEPLYEIDLYPGEPVVEPVNLTVQAVDLDTGINAKITYAIITDPFYGDADGWHLISYVSVSGPQHYFLLDVQHISQKFGSTCENNFQINATTGVVTLNTTLSEVSSCHIAIGATESTGKSSTAYCIITVNAENAPMYPTMLVNGLIGGFAATFVLLVLVSVGFFFYTRRQQSKSRSSPNNEHQMKAQTTYRSRRPNQYEQNPGRTEFQAPRSGHQQDDTYDDIASEDHHSEPPENVYDDVGTDALRHEQLYHTSIPSNDVYEEPIEQNRHQGVAGQSQFHGRRTYINQHAQ